MSSDLSSLSSFIAPLKQIMFAAGQAILDVYESTAPLQVEHKADDSPVTKADHAAHKIIDDGLNALTPLYPILSEEGATRSFAERSKWQRYWLVDPLDGTKEFISKNDEFTVNIALIDDGEPILGMVYVPVKQVLYYGAVSLGSWKESWKEQHGTAQRLQSRRLSYDANLKVVGSRRHGAEALTALLTSIASKFSSVDLVNMGSSLKICALAEGSADWYPRLALTSEWDTAAAHAVLNAAGGKIIDDQLQPLRYNQKDSLLNPFFHAIGDAQFTWETLLNEATNRA